MGFRFRKSVKIAPGVKLNLGKKSAGISIGGKGGGVSFNTKTGVRTRASIPGTGISYSSKLGGSSNGKKSPSGTVSRNSGGVPAATGHAKKPVAARWWFVALAVLMLIGGIGNLSSDISAAVFGILIGAVMLYFSYKKIKECKGNPLFNSATADLFNRHLQIFDESVQLFMETKNPETFFGRYADAVRAADAMAEMGTAPIVHGEPPQAAVDMLVVDKEKAETAFLDRYAKDIRMKAYELTRGRKAKIESFKLITSEYEDKMTAESIAYRDKLYAEMLAAIDEQ